MQLNILKADAAKHTVAYQQISKKLGKGIKWTYVWCQSIQSTNFMDIISGKAQQEAAKERTKTLEQRLADVKPCIGCSLKGQVGKKSHTVMLDEVPDKVLDSYRTQFAKDIAEEQRVDALTDEQREAEVQSLLKELRKDPGFMEFRVRGLEPDSHVD